MVGTVIAPALSGIVEHLNFKYSPGLLITLPSLGVVVFASFIGRLLNKIGSVKLLCFGLIPYALLGVIGAFITNDYLLMLDRFLLGGATVAVQVSVTSFIADYFQGENRMKHIAWQGMAIELGGVVFLSIGGVLGEWHWQYPFYIYLVAILCLVLVMKNLSGIKKLAVSKKNCRGVKKKFLGKGSFFLLEVAFFILFFSHPPNGITGIWSCDLRTNERPREKCTQWRKQTDIQTYRRTWRLLDQLGPGGPSW